MNVTSANIQRVSTKFKIDTNRAEQIIVRFNAVEQKLKNEGINDIFSFSNLEQLTSALESAEQKKSSKQVRAENKQGATLVYDNSEGKKIYLIRTQAAAIQMGKGTKWCISALNDNAWATYIPSTIYYVFIEHENEIKKFAVVIEKENYASEIRDSANNDISEDKFIKQTGIRITGSLIFQYVPYTEAQVIEAHDKIIKRYGVSYLYMSLGPLAQKYLKEDLPEYYNKLQMRVLDEGSVNLMYEICSSGRAFFSRANNELKQKAYNKILEGIKEGTNALWGAVLIMYVTFVDNKVIPKPVEQTAVRGINVVMKKIGKEGRGYNIVRALLDYSLYISNSNVPGVVDVLETCLGVFPKLLLNHKFFTRALKYLIRQEIPNDKIYDAALKFASLSNRENIRSTLTMLALYRTKFLSA